MKQNGTPRMADIAQRLGISAATVSRALRADPRITPAVRARVAEAAQALGYQPNPLVSALMATRRRKGGGASTETIALVTNYGRQDWRMKDVCRWEWEGILRRAEALGFAVEALAVQEFGGRMERVQVALRARGIRGVILGFSREEAPEVAFDPTGFCVAGLSAYFPQAVVDRANFHGFYNVRLALEKLQEMGYRRPALITPELNNRVSNNLWSGAFLDWQRALPRRDRCEPFLPGEETTAAEFSDWLYRNAPDSLLVYKYPVEPLLAKRGLRVPQDLGLAYLYRTPEERGRAAGIDGNLNYVGAAALDLVVERLYANATGPTEHPKEVLIKGTWHPGVTLATTAPPPAPRRGGAPGRARR